MFLNQPPLGGCVLKPMRGSHFAKAAIQPPLGGCVLKLSPLGRMSRRIRRQPPLGGCVLKRQFAAFVTDMLNQPPLGGCVLKLITADQNRRRVTPAAFRRLCVETSITTTEPLFSGSSRL